MSPANPAAAVSGHEVPSPKKTGKRKSTKTIDVVLIGCKRWSPRLATKIFHSRDENGHYIVHTVPEHIGRILLKKRSLHGVRYFRPARPEDYEKKDNPDEVDISEDEEPSAFSPDDVDIDDGE